MRLSFSPMKAFGLVAVLLVAPLGNSARGDLFDQTYLKLKSGRTYKKQPTGRVEMPTKDGSVTLDNVVEVPKNYNPAKPMALRVNLHGGVGRKSPEAGGQAARPLGNGTPLEHEIVILPRAWGDSPWWSVKQIDNVLGLLNRVKQDYNIDESRVYISGGSDGGTGSYFFGMREATPWAAFVPLIGQPLVLADPRTKVEGQLYAGNLVNCPIYAVNGGRDPLYPSVTLEPIMSMFRRGGVNLVWQVYPAGEHNTSWWPEERPKVEKFLHEHRRVAHPEMVSWETERTDRYNRFRWLVIDQLGKRPSDIWMEDLNTTPQTSGNDLEVFPRGKPSGRVFAVRKGNTFEVKTRGVEQFTLLLSPEVVNFAKPVEVHVNGRPVYAGMVGKDLNVLTKWAATDNDRTMLYGAELKLTVP